MGTTRGWEPLTQCRTVCCKAALADAAAIRTLYPYVTERQLEEALDLERQLAKNLAMRDAA